jgi:hypothetical protein
MWPDESDPLRDSGWGDPAFKIADRIAHPAYVSVPRATWAWLVEHSCAGSADPKLALRVKTYAVLQLVDWAVFFAGKAHQHRHGAPPPERLVDRPAAWYAALPAQAAHYLDAATAALAASRPT